MKISAFSVQLKVHGDARWKLCWLRVVTGGGGSRAPQEGGGIIGSWNKIIDNNIDTRDIKGS